MCVCTRLEKDQVERKKEKEQRLGHATGRRATLCDWISFPSSCLPSSSLETDRTHHIPIYQHFLYFVLNVFIARQNIALFLQCTICHSSNQLKDNLYKGASFDLVLLWPAIMQHNLTTTTKSMVNLPTLLGTELYHVWLRITFCRFFRSSLDLQSAHVLTQLYDDNKGGPCFVPILKAYMPKQHLILFSFMTLLCIVPWQGGGMQKPYCTILLLFFSLVTKLRCQHA